MTSTRPWQSFARALQCTRCERRAALDRPQNLCACGAPFAVRYDLEAGGGGVPRARGQAGGAPRYCPTGAHNPGVAIG